MTTQTRVSYLRQAGISYLLGGLFLIINGIPYWLGHRSITEDPLLKAHQLVGIIRQIDDLGETLRQLWAMVLSAVALGVAHYSLWRVGQPTGLAKRSALLMPLVGACCHLLCFEFPLPFAPLGTLLTGLGMLWVGGVSVKARIWPDWKRYTPLYVGLFPFMIQLPFYLILGTPPYQVLPLWGLPIGLLGYASWLGAKEIDSVQRVEGSVQG